MKYIQHLVIALISMLMGVSVSSCSDDVDVTPTGICFGIKIQNQEGENLLDPETPDNLVGNLSASVVVNGKTIPLKWSAWNQWLPGEIYTDVSVTEIPDELRFTDFAGTGEENCLCIGLFSIAEDKNYTTECTLNIPEYDVATSIKAIYDKESETIKWSIDGGAPSTACYHTITLDTH